MGRVLAAIGLSLAVSVVAACGFGGSKTAGPGETTAPTQQDEPTLIAALGDEDSSVRADAAEALGELGDPQAVDPLIAVLDDEDVFVRLAAVEALGKIGEASAVPALTKALWQSGETPLGESLADVQTAAATALAAIGDPSTVKPLVQYTARGNLDEDLVPTIAEMGKPAVKPLIEILGHSPARQREVAAQVLGEIGDPRAVKPLLAFSRKNPTGTAALVAIGKPAVEPLVQALDDSAIPIRATAAQVLGEIGDRRAIEGLREALGDPEDPVWHAASDALVLLHRNNAAKLLPWLESESTRPIYYGLIGLGKKGTEDELVAALETWGDESMAVDYLNCGSPKLEAAAKRWAEAHGYTVYTTPGVKSETWGRLG
jgi:HEAT repeat protein